MDFRILLEKITPRLKYIARMNTLYGFYSQDDLFQEMCIYLWQQYRYGLPIGINESYVVKGCEFHLKNFLRKGRPKIVLSSLDESICSGGITLVDILEDDKADSKSRIEARLTIDDIKDLGLTDKENSVLSLLLKGHTMREIAVKLDVSHVMVLKYKNNIRKKWKKKGYQK
ncbi:MAG: LuxR C-terminal-related transcriptional regulator [Candidatus Kaelpia aquatica]|nr:LuxR C-terminal-related transcriptional regulator [Candidatus Kaelpia aquatica]